MPNVEDIFKIDLNHDKPTVKPETNDGNININPSNETGVEPLFDGEINRENKTYSDMIMEFCDKYPRILSRTKKGSGVYNDTLKVIDQILENTFICGWDWDNAWLTRMSNYYPLEDVHFTLHELNNMIGNILKYIDSRNKIGIWWPKGKVSLRDFFVSKMRSGKYWSPFLEYCCKDCSTVEMLEDQLGDNIMSVVDEIKKDLWFVLDYDGKKKFLSGIMGLFRWYRDNRDDLMKTQENMIHINSFIKLLELIRQCNCETKFLYPGFTSPNMANWEKFKTWSYNNRGVKL